MNVARFPELHTPDRTIARNLKRAIEDALPGADVFVDGIRPRAGSPAPMRRIRPIPGAIQLRRGSMLRRQDRGTDKWLYTAGTPKGSQAPQVRQPPTVALASGNQ